MPQRYWTSLVTLSHYLRNLPTAQSRFGCFYYLIWIESRTAQKFCSQKTIPYKLCYISCSYPTMRLVGWLVGWHSGRLHSNKSSSDPFELSPMLHSHPDTPRRTTILPALRSLLKYNSPTQFYTVTRTTPKSRRFTKAPEMLGRGRYVCCQDIYDSLELLEIVKHALVVMKLTPLESSCISG
jgi:hypothetical protein